jgi:uncharacterized membrane protein
LWLAAIPRSGQVLNVAAPLMAVLALVVDDLVVLALAVAIAAFASRQTRLRQGHP